MRASELTVGIDIGTSSVKAVAADAEGRIVAAAQVAHEFRIPSAGRLEHDADVWCRGPLAALDALGIALAAGVCVDAMVPSLAAFGHNATALSPGLLYGDERGATGSSANPSESGEFAAMLAWLAAAHPDAAAYWPAQAAANRALCGKALISTTVAATTLPLFDWTGWDSNELARAGVRADQLPEIVPSLRAVGEVGRLGGAVLEAGTIDALGEQLVAGADDDGDVLVICGTTLIVWAVNPSQVSAPGYYSVPHTVPGKWLLGGPSNAGGMFLDWARRLSADTGVPAEPNAVPVWVPYVRGERVPLADPNRRAEVFGLDLTHGPESLRRAAFEAAGFTVRRMIEASPEPARRIVAVGGGTKVAPWMSALADCTGLAVHTSAHANGAALGAAYLARVAAGLEADTSESSRWACPGAVVEPDPAWVEACDDRYRRWRERAD